MKKLFFLLLLSIGWLQYCAAQNVPLGMKYQAVARKVSGEVLPNHSITLRIELRSAPAKGSITYYSEEHPVTTNPLGLFDLVVGEGENIKGIFNDIPWSTEDIWMAVSLKEKGADFSIITESKLLAVPYAFHAITASRLSNNGKAEVGTLNTAGVPANVWSLQGNYNSNPETDKLGTTDYKDLVIVTNNLERLRITKDGNINMANSLTIGNNLIVNNNTDIGNDLTVRKNVYLNTTGGSTTNNGAFSVANMSATNLSGKLTVGKITNLNDSLKVNNMSPTYLTGKLTVDKPVYFKDRLNVDSATTINNSLTVIKDDTGFVASIINTNGSTGDGLKIKLGKTHPAWNGSGYLNVTTPAEVFDGAIGTIKGWVFNHNAFSPSQLLTFIPSAYLAGSACTVVNQLTGALNNALGLPVLMPHVQVFPGFSFSLSMPPGIPDIGFSIPSYSIGGFPIVPPIPNIDCSALGLPSLSVPNINFTNVSNSLTNDNQFISFVDKNDRQLGSIRAQSVTDWEFNYLDGTYFVNLMAGMVGIDVVNGVANAIAGFTNMAKSYNSIGVEYASGHGDYAEWLERSNPTEFISAGDIVGVKGGKVSKNIEGAEQILVVSENPIVLGNAPIKEREPYGNKIAFTGQVPVKVIGPVNMGDYIIANRDIPGYGIAVKPAAFTTNDLNLTVGRSWETNLNEGPKMVNTLIGIDNGEYIKILQDSQEKIKEIELRMKLMEEKMSEILSGKGKKKIVINK
jgi:hypothetical protein